MLVTEAKSSVGSLFETIKMTGTWRRTKDCTVNLQGFRASSRVRVQCAVDSKSRVTAARGTREAVGCTGSVHGLRYETKALANDAASLYIVTNGVSTYKRSCTSAGNECVRCCVSEVHENHSYSIVPLLLSLSLSLSPSPSPSSSPSSSPSLSHSSPERRCTEHFVTST